MDETDEQVVGWSEAGEPAAFVELVWRHGPAVHAYLARRTGRQDADDLLGEVWLRAFKGRASYDRRCPDARPWLYGIARNVSCARTGATRLARWFTLSNQIAQMPGQMSMFALMPRHKVKHSARCWQCSLRTSERFCSSSSGRNSPQPRCLWYLASRRGPPGAGSTAPSRRFAAKRHSTHRC